MICSSMPVTKHGTNEGVTHIIDALSCRPMSFRETMQENIYVAHKSCYTTVAVMQQSTCKMQMPPKTATAALT